MYRIIPMNTHVPVTQFQQLIIYGQSIASIFSPAEAKPRHNIISF